MFEGARSTAFTGVAFAHLDLASATRLLLSPRGLGTAAPWRLVNTYSVSLMAREPGYADVLRGEGVNLADGRPVAWALGILSRRAGSPTVPDHVRGPSFFANVLDAGRAKGVRHFLLGGTPETLAQLALAITDRYPGVRIVGAESPPFRPLTVSEQAAQDQRIRRSGADLVWVGLGTPRQDVEAERLARETGRPVIAVGAAFDFLAGTKSEAPLWMRRASLEWLYRFAQEPRRLWHRYTLGLARFAAVAARELTRRPVVVTAPNTVLASSRPGGYRPFADAERLGA
jgi:N-acetylglucosaminyldiphosphoundecaprenol N-acetyl-beta-D-mannosaminyltransferase